MKKGFNASLISLLVFLLSLSILLGCGLVNPIVLDSPTGTITPTLPPTLIPTSTEFPSPTLGPIPTSSIKNQSSISLENTCKTISTGLASLKKEMIFPAHYNSGDFTHYPTDFDPNQYFQVFSHIKMFPDFVLDYLMFSDTMGGKPLLYARKKDAKPFMSDDEFLKAVNGSGNDQRSLGQLNHSQDFLNYITLDGTPDSYLEFEALALLGNQFYLNWHANYNDTKLICAANDTKAINDDLLSFNLTLPQNVIDAAQTIDYQSVAVLSDETVTLRFVTFSKWGGFSENVVILDRQSPAHILNSTKNGLLYYECGIMF